MHLVIFGLGYTGAALAEAAAARGLVVTVVTRQTAQAPKGVTLASFNEPADALASATHLVASAPPEQDGDPVLVRHRAAIAAAPALRWIGYMSTTGVYGDRGGGWVDEATDPAPTSGRGQRRVAAERAWAAARPGAAVDLLRLAGIYGPGRSVFDDLRAGRARRVVKPGHMFGRIHRDDVAGAVVGAKTPPKTPPPRGGGPPGVAVAGGCGPQSATKLPPGLRVLNGSDDEPAASADVTAEAARLLGVPPPPLIPFDEAAQEMSAMARSFWADDRKVRSAATQERLGRRWLYPSYREGLRAILRTEAR